MKWRQHRARENSDYLYWVVIQEVGFLEWGELPRPGVVIWKGTGGGIAYTLNTDHVGGLGYDLSSPVVGSHSVGFSTSGRFCRVCLGTGEFLWPQGAIPSWGWVYCLAPEAPLIRGMPTGRRYFGRCRTRVSFGPATKPTLKNGLVPHSCVGGTYDE